MQSQWAIQASPGKPDPSDGWERPGTRPWPIRTDMVFMSQRFGLAGYKPWVGHYPFL